MQIIKNLQSLILLTSVILTANASPTEFRFGHYYLGMTNQEAAKVGLSNCLEDSSSGRSRKIRCEGNLANGTEFKGAPISVEFDSRTKRVTNLTIQIHLQRGEADDFLGLYRRIGISPCMPSDIDAAQTDLRYGREVCFTDKFVERHARVENYCQSRYSRGDYRCDSIGPGRRYLLITLKSNSDNAREYFKNKEISRMRDNEVQRQRQRMKVFEKGQ